MKRITNNETDGLMNTIIGKDTVITGTLDIKGALRVDGTVIGKVISSDCVTIGASGTVEAEIESNTAVIAGKLSGNVHASEKIELQAKCEMSGDLKTKSLVIEQGAIFCGACNMNEGQSGFEFAPPKMATEPKEEANLIED